MPVWNQISLQDSESVNMYLISSFHDHVMVIVVMIVSLVLYMIVGLSFNSIVNRFFYKNELLELIWTIVPGLMIIGMAMPSLYSLYMLEESFMPLVTFKAVGHQWYWSYEFSDFEEVIFDSYLLSDQPSMASFRLLEVDNNVVVPHGVELRLVTTSADVIHSWALPSMGVKIDSVPGRLNQSFFSPTHVGVLFGQCSEICGSLHSFMPICMEVVKSSDFFSWVSAFYAG
uniref:Cytochrome c oxidase subunit 2 n=1 Tax=Columbicola macrourae TaxID=128993 RepID=A0A6G7SK41_9NEOP|nr:cytochrome oxidase subunit 2 [Columbicola macrourae]